MGFLFLSISQIISSFKMAMPPNIKKNSGLVFTIKALIVAAIGGFANPVGILIGGILFGIFESLSNYMDSGFGDLYPLLAALVIIAIKPSGLFSERGTDVR